MIEADASLLTMDIILNKHPAVFARRVLAGLRLRVKALSSFIFRYINLETAECSS
jgi:hypothetical protein